MSERIFVAMSGGVDSSVAAYLLKEAGRDVSGIHLELYPNTNSSSEVEHAELELSCHILGIPLYYLDLKTEFRSYVIDYFCEEYSRGHTPNPCIRCNKNIKFGLLLDKITNLGGDFLATGHYARVMREDHRYKLLKGIDPKKDQSYFLYMLGQKELARTIFPLGEKLKTGVKQLAHELRLPAVARKESQDICFLPGRDSRAFIARYVKSYPGDIIDVTGRIIGRHQGLGYYTIGQRQGIGLSSTEGLFVTAIEVDTNRLTVGPQSELYKKRVLAKDLHWVSGKAPEGVKKISAKLRYSATPAGGNLAIRNGKAEISFASPQRAIAPGQSIVFYDQDMVIGGGIIAEAF